MLRKLACSLTAFTIALGFAAASEGSRSSVSVDDQDAKVEIKKIVIKKIILAKKKAVLVQDSFQPLFNGTSLAGWKTVLKDDKADPAKTFVVKDGEIQVSGEPFGYIYTEKSYKNYVVRYSWTFPKDQPEKTTMNTGLLVHIQGPHTNWLPKSVEPQGRYKDHGKIYFPSWPKDSKDLKESTFDEDAQKKALKASHEWNTTEATVRADGSISVSINGTAVATGKSALTSGPIGFQSEGARVHFKDIKIKMLD